MRTPVGLIAGVSPQDSPYPRGESGAPVARPVVDWPRPASGLGNRLRLRDCRLSCPRRCFLAPANCREESGSSFAAPIVGWLRPASGLGARLRSRHCRLSWPRRIATGCHGDPSCRDGQPPPVSTSRVSMSRFRLSRFRRPRFRLSRFAPAQSAGPFAASGFLPSLHILTTFPVQSHYLMG